MAVMDEKVTLYHKSSHVVCSQRHRRLALVPYFEVMVRRDLVASPVELMNYLVEKQTTLYFYI